MSSSSEDLKKYPFLGGAEELLAGLSLGNLGEFPELLEKTEKRIRYLLRLSSEPVFVEDKRDAVAIFSASLAIVSATGNKRLMRSFAYALSRELERNLSGSPLTLYVQIANSIGVRCQLIGAEFEMPLIDYLRLKGVESEPSLLLPQLKLQRGMVYFAPNSFRKLLAVVFRRVLVDRMEAQAPELRKASVDPKVGEVISSVSSEFLKKRGQEVDISSLSPVESLYPPCVKFWISQMNKGINIPHLARFLVATFLLSLDLSTDEILPYFSHTPDYDERIARYQIEDLAGQKGSGKRYSVPRCDTLRTTGVCTCRTGLCQRMTSPLLYYRISIEKSLKGDPNAGRDCS